MFRAPFAMTITGIDCIVNAATSTVITVQEADADCGTPVAVEAAITCATTMTTEAAGIDNAGIDAGDCITVLRGTNTGSPTQVMVTIEYTKND